MNAAVRQYPSEARQMYESMLLIFPTRVLAECATNEQPLHAEAADSGSRSRATVIFLRGSMDFLTYCLRVELLHCI